MTCVTSIYTIILKYTQIYTNIYKYTQFYVHSQCDQYNLPHFVKFAVEYRSPEREREHRAKLDEIGQFILILCTVIGS